MPAEDGGLGCMHLHVGKEQLPFHSKERTTHSVLPLQLFPRGGTRLPRGNRFREMSGYLKALLAAAHVLMVNGVATVVVLAGTPQPGSENRWDGSACLKFIWWNLLNLKLTFGHLKGQTRPDPDMVPSIASCLF